MRTLLTPWKQLTGTVDWRAVVVQSLNHIRIFATPWTAAHQASLSITNSQSLPKLMSIESVMDVSLSELWELVMDREAWRAVIHGVSKSRIRLSDRTNSLFKGSEELMFSNCDLGEYSWESHGLQGDQTSQNYRTSALNIHWKDWYWNSSSNTLATWCEEPTH